MKGRAAHSRAEVRDLISRLVIEIGKIPPESISDQATIDDALKMESVVLVEIQVAIEDQLNIELDLLEVVELNEFGAIVDYVYEQASAIR